MVATSDEPVASLVHFEVIGVKSNIPSSVPGDAAKPGSLGAVWGGAVELRGKDRPSAFLWAHTGEKPNGCIEFLENHKLSTKWGEGEWSVHKNDSHMLDISFNTMKHVCRMGDDGIFEVKEKYGWRTGKKKAGECRTKGWPYYKQVSNARSTLPRCQPSCSGRVPPAGSGGSYQLLTDLRYGGGY